MARDWGFTSGGRDRLAERTVAIAIVALLAGITGISIWAQNATSGGSGSASSHVHTLQVAETSASELAGATTVSTRLRAVSRASTRLDRLPATATVRAAREALAAERVALALPPAKAATRAQRLADARTLSSLQRISATERGAAATALASLRRAQDRAWKFTLAAFPTGLLLLGALLMLLRMLQRRQRAGAAAELAHLEKAAVTDPLTGLRNRRTFDDDLARALAKGRVCLVMLDLDGLKQTNERLGHAVGDERIRAVSAAVRAADRTATGYRLGGDEFAAILAGHGADAGHRFAHRVQDAMRVQHGGDAPSVAVGVAVGEMRCPPAT